MGKIIKGRELMLFIESGTGSTKTTKTIAFATNHTLTINADTIDISNKDFGAFAGNETSKISWEMSAEAMYCASGDSSASATYDELFAAMISNQHLKVKFGVASNSMGSDGLPQAIPSGGWTPSGSLYQGEVLITSLELNAPDGEMASLSISMSGYGPITKAS